MHESPSTGKSHKHIKTFLIRAIILCLSGCSGINTKPPIMGGEMVWASNSHYPKWANTPPQHDAKVYYFVGQSDKMPTERIARDQAILSASAHASEYFFSSISSSSVRGESGSYSVDSTADVTATLSNEARIESQQVLTRLSVSQSYVEQWSVDDEIMFKAHVLMSLPKKDGDKAYSIARKRQSGE